jgi:oligopeptide/dipeptide ABC transporter ATP-binding protein
MGDEQVISIPGAPPRLDGELSGCPFAPRCSLVEARCRQEPPGLARAEAGERSVACHVAHGDPARPPRGPAGAST